MGRGAATMYAGSLADADCIVIEGSNIAECHPCAFKWVMQAKQKGAKIIHVDPRFTRTSAHADIYAPIRPGTDIAFVGGLINYMFQNDKTFKEYVAAYTNAPYLVSDDFKDTEDLDGVFSGLLPYKGEAINGFVGNYDSKSWGFKRDAPTPPKPDETGRLSDAEGTGTAGAVPGGPSGRTGQAPPQQKGPPFDDVVKGLLLPAVKKDPTLQDPRCVYQVVKRHYSRYTPEMVEKITGCPRDTFLKIAETIAGNSGKDRTTSWVYAVGWTQHTYGPQMISNAALLMLLTGNMGRPGGGIQALRGHATIQGSTDIPTLYHSIHGYMDAPSALRAHETLLDYIKNETTPDSYFANLPKFLVSYLKSMWGDKATKDNDFGWDWHPKITADHSHMPMMQLAADGKVKGIFLMGQNPATSINGDLQRKALRNAEWLVVKDNFEHESASFWYAAPEVKSGKISPADIKTEVFLFPSAQVAEMEGSFTNTQRWVQWHEKATEPPGDARSDAWFTHQLAKRLKKMYESSTAKRDEPIKNLLWEFDRSPEDEAKAKIKGEPDALKILKEVNGYQTADPSKHLASFTEMKDDGSTTGASWIYTGVYPDKDTNKAAARKADPNNSPGSHLGWAFSWPANRRIMYNRASADPKGDPWSERKKWVWWDASQKKWVGNDVPDFSGTKPPDDKPKDGGIAFDAIGGDSPFIMRSGGKARLFVNSGLIDGPIPTHYEPAESPVHNLLYPKQDGSPVAKIWKRDDNKIAAIGDKAFPHVITTYRLTEHHLSGVMTRWLPWLAELQPELFIEMSPELAQEKGIKSLDFVKISTLRGTIKAKALVTKRLQPLTIDGQKIHVVGMPWHWGYMGLSTGDIVNTLTPMVGDPNVSIHEGKAFVCNVEKA